MSLRRPLRVLGDGLFENGRRVTVKPFSCDAIVMINSDLILA